MITKAHIGGPGSTLPPPLPLLLLHQRYPLRGLHGPCQPIRSGSEIPGGGGRGRCRSSCSKSLAPHQKPAQPSAVRSPSTLSCLGVFRTAAPGLHESDREPLCAPACSQRGRSWLARSKFRGMEAPHLLVLPAPSHCWGSGLGWLGYSTALWPSSAGGSLGGPEQFLPSWWYGGFYGLKNAWCGEGG